MVEKPGQISVPPGYDGVEFRNFRGAMAQSTTYYGFNPDIGNVEFEIRTIVRLVMQVQVRGLRHNDKSRLTVSLIYGVWLISWF